MSATAIETAAIEQIAVGEQNRGLAASSLDAHRVFCKYVWPVDEKRDAPKSFCLTLGAVYAARYIKPLQRLIRFRITDRGDLELERLLRHLRDGQLACSDSVFPR